MYQICSFVVANQEFLAPRLVILVLLHTEIMSRCVHKFWTNNWIRFDPSDKMEASSRMFFSNETDKIVFSEGIYFDLIVSVSTVNSLRITVLQVFVIF